MLRSWGGRTARARAGFCPAWTLQSCSVAYAKPADSSPRPRSPGRERAAMSVGAQRLREDADAIRRGAVDKGEDPTIVDRALEVDAHRRTLLGEGDRLKNERNTASKRIGDAIRAGASPTGPEVAAMRQASVDAGARIEAIDRDLAAVEAELEQLLLRIPNPADPDVPVGGPEASTIVRAHVEIDDLSGQPAVEADLGPRLQGPTLVGPGTSHENTKTRRINKCFRAFVLSWLTSHPAP